MKEDGRNTFWEGKEIHIIYTSDAHRCCVSTVQNILKVGVTVGRFTQATLRATTSRAWARDDEISQPKTTERDRPREKKKKNSAPNLYFYI